MVSGGRGIGGGRGVVRLLLWVDSGSLIGDISDISIITIAGVLDMLDSAIGKSNRVGSGDVGGTIRLLLSVEVGLGVVISNSVGEGVGGDLIGVLLGLVGNSRGVVSWSSLHNNSSSGQLVVPFIGWELQQDDGQWRELRDQNSRQIFTLNITIQHDEPPRDDKTETSDVLKMMDVKRMRTYDQLKELDIEENEESLRSFLVFPLTLTLPGKGEFRKMIGPNKTFSGRPLYNRTQTGEIIFFEDDFWRLCSLCDYTEEGSFNGSESALMSNSPSLMIPRLLFQEWSGFEFIAAELSKEMTASSRVWPYYTPWTLSDVKTAAWLVENDHLTQLEKVMFSSDLESTSITSDMDSIRRVAFVTLSKTDEEILIKPIQ